ncbi:MAG: HAD-IC family P-type ATPase [Lacisediminihabitans sp.]
MLALVASAETLSSHVLAPSIIAAAHSRGLTIVEATSSREVAAMGVISTVADHVVAVGTLGFISERAPETQAVTIAGGELAIYVSVDEKFAGTIIAADPIRANAGSTIEALRQHGIGDVIMLTGDAQATADHVAAELGITHVRADCLPSDKVDAVRSITARPVLMVGDGVNDAPVLATADIGVAMGARGATAASESASAVILIDDISVIVRAVEIGQYTVRIAVQSIWLGIGLSVGLMVIAAFGFIPATLGAGIQEVVDLASILNALRALRPRESH